MGFPVFKAYSKPSIGMLCSRNSIRHIPIVPHTVVESKRGNHMEADLFSGIVGIKTYLATTHKAQQPTYHQPWRYKRTNHLRSKASCSLEYESIIRCQNKMRMLFAEQIGVLYFL